MSSIARKNIAILEDMGYWVEEETMFNDTEVKITLKLHSGIGFMVNVRRYHLQSDETVTLIVRQFNDMIRGRLRLEE